MENINTMISCIIGLTLLNVWLIRFNMPTSWRGGSAQNMKEEFSVYGLPTPVLVVVGILKVSIGIMLIASVWFPFLIRPASGILSVLMISAVLMHIKVKDPIKKSLPAFTLFTLSVYNVVATAS